MKVELAEISGALQEAIDAARMDPEGEDSDITNHIMGKLGEHAEREVERRKEAEHRLKLAAKGIDALGETPEAPNVNALIGIGLALLANGEDAEFFYAGFAGSNGARVETFTT